MNQLMNSEIKMTSLDLAELTGKEHKHIMRDIREEINKLGKELGESIFGLSSYKTLQNKELPCYTFGRKGAMQLALKYDATTRFKVIERIEQLEKQQQPKTQLEVLQGTINQLVEQDKRMNQLEGQVNNISNIVSMNNVGWREKVNVILKRIAKNWTGVEPYRSVVNLSYERLEKRAGCKLEIRLNNRKERAISQGMSKTYVKKINKLDVIAEEKRLVEIYIQIVKEMAIQFKVNINDFKFDEVI
ncbi:Rha family transcriptional regulator [Bacillus swezeyi]|uniref:Rha family transcriptional regulator n=1 Tax=Bacillus swezeyi TaxID=1925020 RepID=UPI002E1C8A92|nr:Rha family transcriptional regulator [Bacillus swezeyi]